MGKTQHTEKLKEPEKGGGGWGAVVTEWKEGEEKL